MEKDQSSIQLWSSSEAINIPAQATTQQIVEFAKPQLSTRDMRSIVGAFRERSFEMAATFIWAKASVVLKKQIATLGMDFVGEMLGRPDLDQDSDPATSLADYEALSLAEDLSMITATQGLRLKHALDLVTHFTKLEQGEAEEETMALEEALMLLKTCVASILSKPNFEGAIKFADFRKALGERTLKSDDNDVLTIIESPYFFIRTTQSVLLAMVKSAKGATQEHAVGNFGVLLPLLWPKLREPEKWQVGQSYAEVNAQGNRLAAAGLKRALVRVRGFDFVPESLRSHTFTEAAAKVLATHFSFNNFYNEAQPMETLANLGTSIPKPAFGKCMEATLAVWLGNPWGNSWGAAPYAKQVLDLLRREQWEYYLNEFLRRDRTVLDKLNDENPARRWVALVETYRLADLSFREAPVRKLIEASARNNFAQLQQNAEQLRSNATR